MTRQVTGWGRDIEKVKDEKIISQKTGKTCEAIRVELAQVGA